MGYVPPDYEGAPFVIATVRVPHGLQDAIRLRAAAEGVDAAVIHRRLLRAGAKLEGLDLSGMNRPPQPLPVVIDA